MRDKCFCGGRYKRTYVAMKDDQFHAVYVCDHCKNEVFQSFYRYQPETCPKHHWGFESWGFYDDPYKHEVYWNMLCDRCGKTERRPFTTDTSTFSVRWDG